jgi:hypothetical protein
MLVNVQMSDVQMSQDIMITQRLSYYVWQRPVYWVLREWHVSHWQVTLFGLSSHSCGIYGTSTDPRRFVSSTFWGYILKTKDNFQVDEYKQDLRIFRLRAHWASSWSRFQKHSLMESNTGPHQIMPWLIGIGIQNRRGEHSKSRRGCMYVLEPGCARTLATWDLSKYHR